MPFVRSCPKSAGMLSQKTFHSMIYFVSTSFLLLCQAQTYHKTVWWVRIQVAYLPVDPYTCRSACREVLIFTAKRGCIQYDSFSRDRGCIDTLGISCDHCVVEEFHAHLGLCTPETEYLQQCYTLVHPFCNYYVARISSGKIAVTYVPVSIFLESGHGFSRQKKQC